MSEYLKINEVLKIAMDISECKYKEIPQKRNVFQGRKDNLETVTICLLKSKSHTKGFYTADITKEQMETLGMTDKSFVIFRLEERAIFHVMWEDLEKLLINVCKRNSGSMGEYWRIHIYNEFIKVSDNPDVLPITFSYL